MRPLALACTALLCFAALPVRAADNLIEQLSTCQVSWLDWKDDQAKTQALAQSFNAAFAADAQGHWAPQGRVAVIGLPVAQAFPESVGMGVGFSVTVDATFDVARKAVEKAAGKTLQHCETGDGMRSCDLEVADKRTLMVMSGDKPGVKTTLIGCYYYYEK